MTISTFQKKQLSPAEQFESAKRLKFFSRFAESEIWEIVNASAWQEFEPGTQIVQAQASVSAVYVVVTGEAAVMREGVQVERLGRSSCFGEIGLVDRPERASGIVALSPVTVMKVKSAELENISAQCRANLYRAYLKSTAQRLVRATDIIVDAHST